MYHAINVSQSDFTGNYLHAAIQVKTRQKQNSTLALMSAIKAIGAVSLFKPSRNKEFRDKMAKKKCRNENRMQRDNCVT